MGLISRIFGNRKPVSESDSEVTKIELSNKKTDEEYKIKEPEEIAHIEENLEEGKGEVLNNNQPIKLQIEKIVEFDKLSIIYKNHMDDVVRQEVRNRILILLDSLQIEFTKKSQESDDFARCHPNVVFASVGMVGLGNVPNDLAQKYDLLIKQVIQMREKINLALRNIGEQELYIFILKNSKGNEIRSEVIELVNDQEVLLHIAENDVEWTNRLSALKKIENPEVISNIAKNNSIDRIRDEAKEILLEINKKKK